MNSEEIKKSAKAIMDNFVSALERVKIGGEDAVVREKCERDEGTDCGCGLDREILFENAPEKSGDFIVGEKGGWK